MAKSFYSFERSQRLLKAIEFKRVFEKAYRSSDIYLTILARPNTLEYARLGLAISKKRLKLAVARNRVKRFVRESFRLHQHELANMDYVVLARNGIAKADNHTLRHSLATHWQHLSHRCKKS